MCTSKNISPTAWLFMWLFVREATRRIDAIHSGHLQTKPSPRSFTPVCAFCRFFPFLYLRPSPQSAKHGDLLKRSCLQEKTSTPRYSGRSYQRARASWKMKTLVPAADFGASRRWRGLWLRHTSMQACMHANTPTRSLGAVTIRHSEPGLHFKGPD